MFSYIMGVHGRKHIVRYTMSLHNCFRLATAAYPLSCCVITLQAAYRRSEAYPFMAHFCISGDFSTIFIIDAAGV